MTEHCVNNGTSVCQTMDATHLIITFEDFCARKTLGFTYCGKRSELEFHLVADTKAHEYRLSLHVTNNSADKWHILTYEDPLDNNTEATVKELPAKGDLYLYSIREFWYGKSDELVIFFRLDCDAAMLLAERIDQEQLERLYRSLESLQQDAQFADMTVNGVPAHRAVVAAASDALHQTVSELESNRQVSTVITTNGNTEQAQAIVDTSHESDNKEKLLEAQVTAKDQDSGTKIRDAKEDINQEMLLLLNKMLGAQVNEEFVERISEMMSPVVRDMWATHNSQQSDIEPMEVPMPDNYTLIIEELHETQESFLRYIYSGDAHRDTYQAMVGSANSLIAVAIIYNLPGLVNAIELNISRELVHKDHEKDNLFMTELLSLAELYDLSDLQMNAVKVMRRIGFISHNENVNNAVFNKYILSMPSNHTHQKQSHYTFTVSNISQLDEEYVFSGVFHICGAPVAVRVNKIEENLSVYLILELDVVTKPLLLSCSCMLLAAKDMQYIRSTTTPRLFSYGGWGWNDFCAWSVLTDPERGFIVNDSAKIVAYVELIE